VVHDGPAALDAARRLRPDLLVLDVLMPGMNGLLVCRTLRQESDLLVLMLTARATEDGDQTRFTLSSGNVIRIVAVTGAILLAAVIATIVAGRRLVHPLRALTSAADGNVPAAVSTRSSRDEIGRLARALNDSTERRDRAEAQHRALVSDVAHELRTPLTNIRPLGGAGLGEQLLVAAHGLDRASVRA
jgi:CheY-like chemotaxis protein